MNKLSSKDIVAGYIEKPLNLVLTKKDILKSAQRTAGVALDEEQLDALYDMLVASHEDHCLRQFDDNIGEIKFTNVWREEEEREEDEDFAQSLSDNELGTLIGSLAHLNSSIIEETEYLQKEYDRELKDLEAKVNMLNKVKLLSFPNDELMTQVDDELKKLEKKLSKI